MKGDKRMLKQNRSLVNVGRAQRDAWSMQQASARREQQLAHVPQQQRPGVMAKPRKSPGAGGKKIPSGRGGERHANATR
jgi:hypothetical protein